MREDNAAVSGCEISAPLRSSVGCSNTVPEAFLTASLSYLVEWMLCINAITSVTSSKYVVATKYAGSMYI